MWRGDFNLLATITCDILMILLKKTRALLQQAVK